MLPWGRHFSSLWQKKGLKQEASCWFHHDQQQVTSPPWASVSPSVKWGAGARTLLKSPPAILALAITSSSVWPRGPGWCFLQDPWSGNESPSYPTPGPGKYGCPSWWSFRWVTHREPCCGPQGAKPWPQILHGILSLPEGSSRTHSP